MGKAPIIENLGDARSQAERLMRILNHGKQRAEVVNVLTSETTKKDNALVGVVASVDPSLEADKLEAAKIREMEAELKRLDDFALLWSQNVVEWEQMVFNVMFSLRDWASSFGKVIGLSAERRSEPFDLFMDMVQEVLWPLMSNLDEAIKEWLLKDLSPLLMSLVRQLKLLMSMHEQDQYCSHLFKTGPYHSFLVASTDYRTLRSRLAAELPTYIALMRRGLAGLVERFVNIQVQFWADVTDHWTGLWEMLRVEGEPNLGSAETISVWRERWADADEVMTKLGLTIPVQLGQVPATSPSAMRDSPAPLPLALPTGLTSRDNGDKHQSRPSTSASSSVASPDVQRLTISERRSFVSQPAKYICKVVHECAPPASVFYSSFPLFTLRMGDLYDVLQEAGHPNIHPGLPLSVDDDDDCLLLCRDRSGLVGWALASFLMPLSPG